MTLRHRKDHGRAGLAPGADTFTIQSGGALRGHIQVPGDKSISHRAIMLGAIAQGDTQITGFLEGEDTRATLAAFRAMGVSIESDGQGHVLVHGKGAAGLSAPTRPLYLGNSGTSMRLLSGILAGQPFASELSGDPSLSRRPMARIADPLQAMGARILTGENGTPPLKIQGGNALSGIDYSMPVASAQVKSCLLLAGIFAQGQTCVQESAPTRDHTERMLMGFDYPLQRTQVNARLWPDQDGEDHNLEEMPNRVCIQGGGKLRGTKIAVPGDISSAAFFLVGASIAHGSELVLENIGINPTRTGVIHILRMMGADITIFNQKMAGAEPVADIRVRSRPLRGVPIPPAMVSLAIDEFPAIFIAAACAEGETTVTDAQELRAKESDRIATMAEGLTRLGIQAESKPDGMKIRGGQFTGGKIASHGDHRVAMAFSMAALAAQDTIVVEDCANVNTSFPGFVETAARAGLGVCGK